MPATRKRHARPAALPGRKPAEAGTRKARVWRPGPSSLELVGVAVRLELVGAPPGGGQQKRRDDGLDETAEDERVEPGPEGRLEDRVVSHVVVPDGRAGDGEPPGEPGQ